MSETENAPATKPAKTEYMLDISIYRHEYRDGNLEEVDIEEEEVIFSSTDRGAVMQLFQMLSRIWVAKKKEEAHE